MEPRSCVKPHLCVSGGAYLDQTGKCRVTRTPKKLWRESMCTFVDGVNDVASWRPAYPAYFLDKREYHDASFDRNVICTNPTGGTGLAQWIDPMYETDQGRGGTAFSVRCHIAQGMCLRGVCGALWFP